MITVLYSMTILILIAALFIGRAAKRARECTMKELVDLIAERRQLTELLQQEMTRRIEILRRTEPRLTRQTSQTADPAFVIRETDDRIRAIVRLMLSRWSELDRHSVFTAAREPGTIELGSSANEIAKRFGWLEQTPRTYRDVATRRRPHLDPCRAN